MNNLTDGVIKKSVYISRLGIESAQAALAPASETPHGLVCRVIDWSHNVGIYDQSTDLKQWEKAKEELEELNQAILMRIRAEESCEIELETRALSDIEDAIGDTIVCLINVAAFHNLNIFDCLKGAVETIEKRKGKMINGLFVKE
jgi:hypothetical protein